MIRLLTLALVSLLAFVPLAGAQDLTLKRVMLSSGGLGYFEYEATVDGDATLRLTVPLTQVDDVLKSLVVYDDKGSVGGLSLPGREPLKQAFKDLPFGEEALENPATLLSTLKGAQVSIGGAKAMTGRIVSVNEERFTSADGKTASTRTRVTLLTERGLQQFILEEAENLTFVDAALREKVTQALVAIQTNRAREARTLELSARGQGKRTVRVAYIVEAPVWKAAYRFTIAAEGARSGLQGWAVVENMSGQDWNDVELTLVSGRPVAFQQALYDAYYVSRPEVPVEVAGRLMPQVDRGVVPYNRPSNMPPPPPPASPPRQQERRVDSPVVAAAPPPMSAPADQVEASDAATQVVFKFPRAVSVANGRTLSIPILDRQVPAQRLAVFQGDSTARNPWAAIRLTNDGETGLPPGIITLYERDKAGAVTYVGDARLSAFPAGETRLLSYALDEKIAIERETGQTERIATGVIANGVLRYSRLVRQTVTYRVKGAAKEPRHLIIVQRRLPGWTLVKPDGKVDLSEGNYRLPFQLPGGEQGQVFEVVQEQTVSQELRLLDGAPEQIRVFSQTREFDQKTRDALARVLQLQGSVAEAQRAVAKVEADRKAIVEEQGRLRDNLARVPANSDLQRRYLATLDKQENELEALAKQKVEAEKAVDAARAALRTFVTQLG
jgi:hypothetical protein